MQAPVLCHVSRLPTGRRHIARRELSRRQNSINCLDVRFPSASPRTLVAFARSVRTRREIRSECLSSFATARRASSRKDPRFPRPTKPRACAQSSLHAYFLHFRSPLASVVNVSPSTRRLVSPVPALRAPRAPPPPPPLSVAPPSPPASVAPPRTHARPTHAVAAPHLSRRAPHHTVTSRAPSSPASHPPIVAPTQPASPPVAVDAPAPPRRPSTRATTGTIVRSRVVVSRASSSSRARTSPVVVPSESAVSIDFAPSETTNLIDRE